MTLDYLMKCLNQQYGLRIDKLYEAEKTLITQVLNVMAKTRDAKMTKYLHENTKLKEDLSYFLKRNTQLKEEVAELKLKKASALPLVLTSENGAKALLSGEFNEKIEIGNDLIEVPVSWATIKDIYNMIVAYYTSAAQPDALSGFVYMVIDNDQDNEVYAVCANEESANKCAADLNDMRVGGATTTIEKSSIIRLNTV